MTNAQFDALAQLLRFRGTPSQEAARMVLVDGVRQADAARETGVTPAAVNNAVTSCRRGMELVRLAAGLDPDQG